MNGEYLGLSRILRHVSGSWVENRLRDEGGVMVGKSGSREASRCRGFIAEGAVSQMRWTWGEGLGFGKYVEGSSHGVC